MSTIQSVLFKRSIWDLDTLKAYIDTHGFTIKKIDITRNFYRVRQFNPRPKKKYFTRKLPGGVEYVIEY